MVLGKLDSHVEKNEMDHILHYTKKKKKKNRASGQDGGVGNCSTHILPPQYQNYY